MINLSRVVLSPHLSQDITIKRTSGGSWQDGQYIKGEPSIMHMQGIVTIASAKDLQQAPEGDRQRGGVKVLTTKRIYITGESNNNYSDIVIWHGEEYKVYSVASNSDYGFYRSLCIRLREAK